MSIRIVEWFFSSLASGISHFFTNTKIQPIGWKKRRANNHGLGLTPSARGRSLWQFCAAPRVFAGYRGHVFAWNFYKATRNADSSSHVGQPGINRSWQPPLWLLLTGLLPALRSSLDWPALLTGLYWSLLLTIFFCLLSDLPSIVHFRFRWRCHAGPLCGFRAKKVSD